MCPALSSGRKVSARGLRKELGDSFQIPYSLSFLYSTQKQKKQTRTLSASFFYISPQEPIRAQCALKERIALACKHASGERVHPQDAPAGAFAERPYGWRVNFGLFVPTKIKPCIATFAMLATLREGRPLPYGDKAKNGCRGGVPPPVRVIFVSPRARRGGIPNVRRTRHIEGKKCRDSALERIKKEPPRQI